MMAHKPGRPRLIIYLFFAALTALLLGCSFPETPADSPSNFPATPGATVLSPATAADDSATLGSGPRPKPTGSATSENPATSRAATESAGAPAPGLLADQPGATGNTANRINAFAPPPDRDLFQLAAELSLKTNRANIPKVVNPEPVRLTQGQKDSFWLVDFRGMQVYQSQFELRLVSPTAYWYVEEGRPVSQKELERSAAEFEANIYPKVTAFFGTEWTPGVDNDPHLNIIHSTLRGVGGYFSSADEHPQSVLPYSNQREIIYINIGALEVGTQKYLEVLAHELQHAAHWNGDSSEETWINEGLSELAVSVAGYGRSTEASFLRTPTISLVHWPLDHANISAHYSGASLFMHYLAAHYSSNGNLAGLVAEPADGIPGIDAYLRQAGYNVTFDDLFRDWVVANILDEDQGVYGYPDREVQARAQRFVNDFSEITSIVPQYAAEYLDLTPLAGPLRLRFQGITQTRLLPVAVGPLGCWWSNSGDSIGSALTRSLDLRGESRPTLRYQVWHNIEEDSDYGYVQVSVDAGRTWDLLTTPHTSPENPIGNSFGVGYTGASSGWVDESIDLRAYGGREILLRFQYVTDDAVNGAGLCFRQFSVSGVGPLANDYPGWQATGFVLIDNQVTQRYMVQIIQAGGNNQVTQLPLDQNNAGEIVIEPSAGLGRLIVAVAAVARQTLQGASYTLSVEPAN